MIPASAPRPGVTVKSNRLPAHTGRFDVGSVEVPLTATTTGHRLVAIELGCEGPRAPEALFEHEVARQLRAYLSGDRTAFDLPVDLRGTEFQRQVWQVLLQIPYGSTITYAELARRVGNPKAARAVGAANGRNPIPIVVPCHRVVAAGGKLGGYGGGLDLKRRLLALEQRTLPLAGGRA